MKVKSDEKKRGEKNNEEVKKRWRKSKKKKRKEKTEKMIEWYGEVWLLIGHCNIGQWCEHIVCKAHTSDGRRVSSHNLDYVYTSKGNFERTACALRDVNYTCLFIFNFYVVSLLKFIETTMDKQELKHASEVTKEVKKEDKAIADAVCNPLPVLVLVFLMLCNRLRTQSMQQRRVSRTSPTRRRTWTLRMLQTDCCPPQRYVQL